MGILDIITGKAKREAEERQKQELAVKVAEEAKTQKVLDDLKADDKIKLNAENQVKDRQQNGGPAERFAGEMVGDEARQQVRAAAFPQPPAPVLQPPPPPDPPPIVATENELKPVPFQSRPLGPGMGPVTSRTDQQERFMANWRRQEQERIAALTPEQRAEEERRRAEIEEQRRLAAEQRAQLQGRGPRTRTDEDN